MIRRLLAVALFALVATPAPAFAQTGTITGRVTEAESGRPLPAATVRLTAQPTLRALTNSEGHYLLRGVPVGSHEVEVLFVGYATGRGTVTVTADQTATFAVALEVEAVELDGLTVLGSATRGQAFALQRQKTAPNITNVVSEELFSRFPDRNAAETVRRLPGISVDRDQGEGEFVQIRGIDQAFNSLTINGIRIPAPDEGGGQRSVGLDLINNNLLGEIEVVKALTPAMDADAVGGVVNFGLRRAPSGGTARINVGAGLNDQTSDFDTYGREILDFTGVLGQRWNDDRFGLLVDGAFYRTARHSLLREFEYDDGDGAIDDQIFAQHTNDYDLVRDRFGFSATGDMQLRDTDRLYVTASYNVYLDNEVRRVADFSIEDERETRETRNRLEDQRVRLFMAGGENDVGFGRLSYKGAWIQATEELPDRTYLRYRRDNPLTGLTNEQVKNLDGTAQFTGLEAPTLDRIRYDDMLKDDADLSGQVDLEIPFSFRDGTSSLQFGSKFLRKDVSYERERFQMTDFASTETLAEGAFGFEDVRFDDPELARVLTDWGSPRNITEDYDASENITALYGMASLHFGSRLSVLAGARWERTSTDYAQPNPEQSETPLQGEGGYDNIMPSLHFTFRPDPATNVRAAWTTGLARPSYERLIPRRIVDDEDRTISYGNPDLEPRTADNFDLLLERFTSRLGVVTAGTFYKRFRAFQTTRVFEELVDGVPYQASQLVMGDGIAEYFGLEFSFNQPLSLVSSALNPLRVFGNYNYTWSEGEIGGRRLPLTNSPRHTANLSLLFDDAARGFSFVVATNYRDAMLIGVGSAEHRDVYYDDEFHIDLSAVKALSNQLSISAQINGLTARQEREVLGDPGSALSRVLQWEEYGPYGTINLQYTFR